MFDLENVTTICKNLRKYADLNNYLIKITKKATIEEKPVHKGFSYPNSIVEKKLYVFYGIFVDYFIRRYISEKIGIPFEDTRAESYRDGLEYYYENLKDEPIGDEDDEDGYGEVIVDQKDVDSFRKKRKICIIMEEKIGDGKIKLIYMKNEFPEVRILKEEEIIPGYQESYEKVINTKSYKTIDIVKDIFNVCNAHIVWFRGKIVTEPVDYDNENLECIIKYLDELLIVKEEILLNPALGGKYFRGDCDLIFNDSIIDIKNSKYDKNSIRDFYQLIVYSYGAFDCFEKKIKKFKIYNPLLGKEYEMVLNDINYDEFGVALKCCVNIK